VLKKDAVGRGGERPASMGKSEWGGAVKGSNGAETLPPKHIGEERETAELTRKSSGEYAEVSGAAERRLRRNKRRQKEETASTFIESRNLKNASKRFTALAGGGPSPSSKRRTAIGDPEVGEVPLRWDG